MTGGADGVVKSATYQEGYKAGITQAIIEAEAEAVLAERYGMTGYASLMRAWAERLRKVRDQ